MQTKQLKDPKYIPDSIHIESGVTKTIVPIALGSVIGHLIFPGLGGVIIGGAIGGVIGKESRKEIIMAKVPVFYSFHFDNDVMRVQQVRNIGSIEGNAPTTPNQWETLKRTGKKAVENWIDQNMKYKRCVVVLIGSETASRPWVEHEIIKAWNDGKALLGIHIHNLKCPRTGTSRKGKNPFDLIKFQDGSKLSSVVPCYDPSSTDTYKDIALNMATWVDHAIKNKAN
ncbi:TIR domain-containing protein [Vibrio sp. ER1A]|uniref:TIR domain-containing protein n=1 Tax=Vibrio sp. ER1A TaxID=1517681 RepID=UPI000A4CC3F9|nr:TIR domain-containing protein [Vibrio sp. ER1A]